MSRKGRLSKLSPPRGFDVREALRRVLHRAADAAIAADDALAERNAPALERALDALRANADRAQFLARGLLGEVAP